MNFSVNDTVQVKNMSLGTLKALTPEKATVLLSYGEIHTHPSNLSTEIPTTFTILPYVKRNSPFDSPKMFKKSIPMNLNLSIEQKLTELVENENIQIDSTKIQIAVNGRKIKKTNFTSKISKFIKNTSERIFILIIEEKADAISEILTTAKKLLLLLPIESENDKIEETEKLEKTISKQIFSYQKRSQKFQNSLIHLEKTQKRRQKQKFIYECLDTAIATHPIFASVPTSFRTEILHNMRESLNMYRTFSWFGVLLFHIPQNSLPKDILFDYINTVNKNEMNRIIALVSVVSVIANALEGFLLSNNPNWTFVVENNDFLMQLVCSKNTFEVIKCSLVSLVMQFSEMFDGLEALKVHIENSTNSYQICFAVKKFLAVIPGDFFCSDWSVWKVLLDVVVDEIEKGAVQQGYQYDVVVKTLGKSAIPPAPPLVIPKSADEVQVQTTVCE